MAIIYSGLEFGNKNQKAVACSAFDKDFLRNRSLIEAVFDELKNLCQIEYSSHRLPSNSMVNLLGGIIA